MLRRFTLVYVRTRCVVLRWFIYARVPSLSAGLYTHELRRFLLVYIRTSCVVIRWFAYARVVRFLLVYDNISVGCETGSALLVATAIIV